ncbi:MAG: hypothetical protein U0163_16250 [Gemmatimonadaceae bacterium]
MPEQDENDAADIEKTVEPSSRHTEIRCHLLRLGAELGLDVWVARNDKSRSYNGQVLVPMPNILDELPTQFNEQQTIPIELIDVLWLKANTILGRF